MSLETSSKRTAQCVTVLCFNSALSDFFFFNTKVSNSGEEAPGSVHTNVDSVTIPQTIVLSKLRGEE